MNFLGVIFVKTVVIFTDVLTMDLKIFKINVNSIVISSSWCNLFGSFS